MAITPKHVGAN